MTKTVLLIALLMLQVTSFSFANESKISSECRHWDVQINKQNSSPREDIVSAFQTLGAISGADLQLNAPSQPLDGTLSAEILVRVDFPDFPGYDFDSDLAFRKQAAETLSELSKKPGMSVLCHVDKSGANNGRGSVSN
jgi:hypothetical protein